MKRPWFRMYAEAVDDEKLRLLAFEDRWHFVALLCLKAQGTLDSAAPKLEERIALKLGLQLPELEKLRGRLMEIGIVSETFQPVSWDKRQYESDTSTERVKAFRERRAKDTQVNDGEGETDLKRDRNVSETPSEQNRTEQNRRDSARSKQQPSGGNGRERKSRRSSRVPEDFLPDLAYARAEIPDIDAEREAQKFRDWEFKTPKSDWAATWRNWIRGARERGTYAKTTTAGGERGLPRLSFG